MRILISKDKDIDVAYPLPWKSSATCFNFKSPTIVVKSASEINSPKEVKTLVIESDLEEYSFIEKMVNLEQLYIYNGMNVTNLSFLNNLVKLKQLCLVDIRVKNLSELRILIDKKSKLYKEGAEKFPKEEFRLRWTYAFEGVYLQSDLYEGDGNELINPEISRGDNICINGKYLSTRYTGRGKATN